MTRVTSKGQVTIPIEIREQLGIEPGAEIEFAVEDGVARLWKKRSRDDWPAYLESLRGTATSGMTTDEIMALTRGEE